MHDTAWCKNKQEINSAQAVLLLLSLYRGCISYSDDWNSLMTELSRDSNLSWVQKMFVRKLLIPERWLSKQHYRLNTLTAQSFFSKPPTVTWWGRLWHATTKQPCSEDGSKFKQVGFESDAEGSQQSLGDILMCFRLLESIGRWLSKRSIEL